MSSTTSTSLTFLRLLRRTWVLWLTPLFLGIVVAVAVNTSTVPVYEASTTVLVVQSPSGEGAVDYASILATKQLMPTLEATVRSNRVLEAAAKSLGAPWEAATIRPMLYVVVPQDTVLIQIAVQAPQPADALGIVTAVTAGFIRAAGDSFRTMQVHVADGPSVGLSPVSTSRPLLSLASVGAGVIVGIILVAWWLSGR